MVWFTSFYNKLLCCQPLLSLTNKNDLPQSFAAAPTMNPLSRVVPVPPWQVHFRSCRHCAGEVMDGGYVSMYEDEFNIDWSLAIESTLDSNR